MPGGQLRRLSERLGFRITFLLALTLLPLALLSAVQTVALSNEAQSRAEAAILGDTVQVAAPVLQRILTAQGAAASLASALAEIQSGSPDDLQHCRRMLAGFGRSNPQYSLAAFVRLDGQMECSSTGATANLAGSQVFKDAVAEPRAAFEVDLHPPLSGAPVLVVVHPVVRSDGQRSGFISLSIPQWTLQVRKDATTTANGLGDLRLFTFDGDGNVLTALNGIEKDRSYLPGDRGLADLAGLHSVAYAGIDGAGRLRIFAVAPIVPQKLYALSSWPITADQGSLTGLPPLVLPALMAVVSLFVAWMAAERLVLRHIRRLRSAIVLFASGSRVVPATAHPAAPLELREVEESFDRMTGTILRDEAELEDAVHQKEVLLREVHHRIKNNLQLISSIMNMQMRRETAPEVRAMMKNLQDRVMSLATIHRELYQTSGVTDVRADELLSGIVTQVLGISTGPGRNFAVETEIDDIPLTPDQAVPLSLLLTEALTNAMKYGGSDDRSLPRLSVSLTREGGDGALLVMTNTLSPGTLPPTAPAAGEPGGFGSQLIRAFAQQLGAELSTRLAGGLYELRLRFSVIPLAEAEERGPAPPVVP